MWSAPASDGPTTSNAAWLILSRSFPSAAASVLPLCPTNCWCTNSSSEVRLVKPLFCHWQRSQFHCVKEQNDPPKDRRIGLIRAVRNAAYRNIGIYTDIKSISVQVPYTLYLSEFIAP